MLNTSDLYPQQLAILEAKAKYQFITGGVGTFKTTACIIKLCSHALAHADHRYVAMAQTFKQIDIVFINEWKEQIDPEDYTYNENAHKITMRNDSVIYLHYADHPKAIDRIQGSNIHGFYIIQVESFRSAAMFDLLDKRVRKGGDDPKDKLRIMDANPGGASHFINIRYLDISNDGFIGKGTKHKQIMNGVNVYNSDIIDHVHVKTTPETSIYTKETIEGWKKINDPIMFDRMVLGKWTQAKGAVYSDFEKTTHLYHKDSDISDNCDYYLAIDYGYVNPFAVLLVAQDYDRNYFIVDEIYKTELHTLEMAKLIKSKFVDEYEIRSMVSDSADPSSKRILEEQLQLNSQFARGMKKVIAGINKVKELLITKGKEGKPRLMIHSRCKNLIREFESYIYEENIDGRPKKELPKKLNDHGLDGLRYLIMTIER